jgi:RND superfamily putative drug exporter
MLKPVQKFVRLISTKTGAKVTLAIWLLAVLAFAFLAPSAGDYEGSSKEASISGDKPSEIAQDLKNEKFPSDNGLTGLLVFHKNGEFNKDEREEVGKLTKWLVSDEKPDHVAGSLPFHEFPPEAQDQMFSDDNTTLLINMAMKKDVSSADTGDALDEIRAKVKELNLSDIEFDITGPAGIASDTLGLFKNGDFVLMIATIVLIFVLLIIIYRSPLLAITPLIIAGIVYMIVDGVLGIAGKYEWFQVDSSAVSIMLVLLFAVLTDYSLFVFSRYREELKRNQSKYDAMSTAIHHVSEPIFFSGGTIFFAMLTLFVTIFEPYRAFAPVFSIAIVFIAIAGLTLIPSMFALLGRRAFWPSIPKMDNDEKQQHRFWGGVGHLVKKHPGWIAGIIGIFLIAGIANIPSIQFSFNQLDSFPEDMSSRKGFENLAEHYEPGDLAPVDVLLVSNEKISKNDEDILKKVQDLQKKMDKHDNVQSVSSELDDDMVTGDADLPRNFLSEDEKAINFSLTLDVNPYDREALNTIKDLRDASEDMLKDSGLQDKFNIHYGGQTAQQADVSDMNNRDMIMLFTVVIVLITIILGFQTHSVKMPLLMVGTILLSYAATLGFGWLIFKFLMGYDAISYRMPVYTFVFMVALGIDYNIMLVSRVREMAKSLPWNEAVDQGVRLTGGVISSAGIILAATFAVLMTQPIEELFLFGFLMAMGILLDTFIIRGFFMPSILILTHRKKK